MLMVGCTEKGSQNRSDIPDEQVCQASGFTSADTFTRNFRAKFGMTPTAYK